MVGWDLWRDESICGESREILYYSQEELSLQVQIKHQ